MLLTKKIVRVDVNCVLCVRCSCTANAVKYFVEIYPWRLVMVIVCISIYLYYLCICGLVYNNHIDTHRLRGIINGHITNCKIVVGCIWVRFVN